MIKLRCVVERIAYLNPDNGYTVLKVKVSGYTNPVTLIGYLLDLPAGTALLCEGEWKVDRKYGNEFVANTWTEIMPSTLFGIERYLSSGLVKGIGPKYAKLIVKQFGLQTLEIIENDIEQLLKVPGIGKKRFSQIQESWEKQKDIKDVMVFLQSYGVSTAYAAKIYKKYGKDSIGKVRQNPYRLADEVWGIGFKMADDIAHNMGYQDDDPHRCRSGILHTLHQLSNEGHVYAEREQLIKAAHELLATDESLIIHTLKQMETEDEIIAEEDAIYHPYYYYAEVGVARNLLDLLLPAEQDLFIETLEVSSLSKETGIEYDEIQLQAIEQAIRSKVMVLTGGPGTGKTTTTQGILAAFQHMGLKILLAAPTGRAAKRMSEATGREAKTIHRLLEYNPQEGCKRNEENPLEGDALIVDECSMIDIHLMMHLMKAIPSNMRLVLVGDVDQLPSVGPGNVLRDIIESRRIPVIRLTRIFRQAQSSRIVMSAHAINQGNYPDTSNGKNTDFFFIKQEQPEAVAETIVELVQKRLPHAYEVDAHQIQVLTPMQKGSIGAIALNAALQKALNPSKVGLTRGVNTFKLGDRVMQLRNNYEKKVFNGDLGYIESVDTDENTLSVNFEGTLVSYEISELEELTLAYATTIHKSQGSEYPIVVMPVMMSHYIMLQRNLIYTGITRAKKICILIGTPNALHYAINNMQVLKRNTKLKERLNM